MKYVLIYLEENALSKAERAMLWGIRATRATAQLKRQYLATAPPSRDRNWCSGTRRHGNRWTVCGEQLGGFFLINAQDLDKRSRSPPRFHARSAPSKFDP